MDYHYELIFISITVIWSFPGHVLDHHRAGLPEHVRAGDGALQAAQVARLLPGRHQPLLRRPLHLRDADQDVRARPTGRRIHESFDT